MAGCKINIALLETTHLTHKTASTRWISLRNPLRMEEDQPEVLNRVFEPFFTTKELGKGTGLGLSTVQGIVKGHGGFAEVITETGRGTTFNIYLPSTAATEPQSAETKSNVMPFGQGEQILVVEDEVAILTMIRETLETYNYKVLTAKHGAEALDLYQR